MNEEIMFFTKVSKSRKQFRVSSILPKPNKNHYPENFPIQRDYQNSDFPSFMEELRTP